MDVKKLEYGKKIKFELGEKVFDTIYSGRFDFLYCFDTKSNTLPVVTTINQETENAASIVIANFELLKSYGLSNDEIKAILFHEEGHILSVNQKDMKGLDLEFDADEYAIPFVGIELLISALEKTKKIIIEESKNKEKVPERLRNIEERIKKIKMREEQSNKDNCRE